MDRWLDYSAGRLTGPAIRNAGFQGAIRYVGTPGRGKNATVAEVNSIRAAGLGVHGVYENTTKDWATGYSGGVAAARAALADPATKAMPGNAVIFVCADMHLTSAQLGPWRQYVLGAQSVLGKRCGAYGFSEAIDRVADLDIWFWQCGSQSVVRRVTHAYQWNNGTTRVSGITCDINYIYRPLTGPLGAGASSPAPAQKGFLEAMAFNDTFKDWAGNTQSVQGWMDLQDRGRYEIRNAVLGVFNQDLPNPIFDANNTNPADIRSHKTYKAFDWIAGANLKGEWANQKLDALTKTVNEQQTQIKALTDAVTALTTKLTEEKQA